MITAEFVFLATILPSLASGTERTEARVSDGLSEEKTSPSGSEVAAFRAG